MGGTWIQKQGKGDGEAVLHQVPCDDSLTRIVFLSLCFSSQNLELVKVDDMSDIVIKQGH